MVPVWVAFVGVLICAGAAWAVTVAGAAGRLDRRGSNGIKTRATRASDAAWVAGHRAALPVVRVVAGVWVAAAVAMLVVSLTWGSGRDWLVHVLLVGVWLVVLAGCVPVVRVANRAARAAE